MASLRMLATLALQSVIEEVLPDLQTAAGMPLDVRFAPTADLLARIGQGEAADVALLTQTAITDLIGRGVCAEGSCVALAESRIAAAVKAGDPHPDIGTLQAFRSTLLAARSVGYSRTGISGAHFASLIERLGIAREVNARAHVLNGGFTATLLVDGRCDLAVQQWSELLTVPGIEIVGPLPEGAQAVTLFAGGRFADSPVAPAARAVLACLAAPRLRPAFAARGLRPPG